MLHLSHSEVFCPGRRATPLERRRPVDDPQETRSDFCCLPAGDYVADWCRKTLPFIISTGADGLALSTEASWSTGRVQTPTGCVCNSAASCFLAHCRHEEDDVRIDLFGPQGRVSHTANRAGEHLPPALIAVLQAESLGPDQLVASIPARSAPFVTTASSQAARLIQDARRDTWYKLAASDVVRNTTRGSRPGSPLADAAFNCRVRRILLELNAFLASRSISLMPSLTLMRLSRHWHGWTMSASR